MEFVKAFSGECVHEVVLSALFIKATCVAVSVFCLVGTIGFAVIIRDILKWNKKTI